MPDSILSVFDSILFINFAPKAPKTSPHIATITIFSILTSTILMYLINDKIAVSDMQSMLVALALCVSIFAMYIKKNTRICPAPLANKPLITPDTKLNIYTIVVLCALYKKIFRCCVLASKYYL